MEESMVMPTLIIDPEFQSKIPPLMDEEIELLKENILAVGEVWEPIVVWNGTIVDGHNRYKIIQEHPEIKWRIREMEFADKWEAFNWMYKNQLGRRNLTDFQRSDLLGRLYTARKHTIGDNQYTTDRVDQNDPPSEKTKSTAEAMEKKHKKAVPRKIRSVRAAGPDVVGKGFENQPLHSPRLKAVAKWSLMNSRN